MVGGSGIFDSFLKFLAGTFTSPLTNVITSEAAKKLPLLPRKRKVKQPVKRPLKRWQLILERNSLKEQCEESLYLKRYLKQNLKRKIREKNIVFKHTDQSGSKGDAAPSAADTAAIRGSAVAIQDLMKTLNGSANDSDNGTLSF